MDVHASSSAGNGIAYSLRILSTVLLVVILGWLLGDVVLVLGDGVPVAMRGSVSTRGGQHLCTYGLVVSSLVSMVDILGSMVDVLRSLHAYGREYPC